MSIARSTILRGPAIVIFDAAGANAKFYTKGDIKVKIDMATFDVDSSAYGKVDERTTQRKVEVSFEPVGEWESLATLFPYGTTNVGTSIFGATDKTLDVHTLDGKKLTFKAAAITKVPDIVLSAVKTRFGEVAFTCIGSDNTPWTTAASLLSIASAAFSDTSFDPANIKTEPVTAAWGASPWDSFATADGVVVSHEMSFQDIQTDSEGIVDMMLSKIVIKAKARPIGLTEQNLVDALKIQGSGNARGKSLSGSDLVITATTGVVTVKGAALHMGGYEFGHAALRLGECEWIGTRTLIAGVVQPLITVA